MKTNTVSNTLKALVVCAMLAPQATTAQKRMNFDNFSTANGLSSDLVFSLAQDSLGHIWVGTDFGLNYFDGTVFKSFLKKDYPLLFRNDIGQLACMPNGQVMVGGGNGFLVSYDGKTDRFTDVSPENYATTYQKSVSGFCADANKQFYVSTSNGIYQYAAAQRRYTPNIPLYKVTEQGAVNALVVDSRNRFWTASTENLTVFDANGKVVSTFKMGDNQQQSIVPIFVPVSANRMLGYGVADRLTIFNTAPNGQISEGGSVMLPFRNLRAVAKAKDGSFWFATDGDGLWMSQSEPKAVSDFQKVLPYGISEANFSKLYSILIDRSGSLWVGSQNSGLWRLRLNKDNGIFTATELGLSTCVASGFANLSAGNHLVASDGIGIFSYNDKVQVPQLYGTAEGLTNKNVTSILNDGNGRIWVTTWGGGLYSSPATNIHFSQVAFDGISSPHTNLFSIIRLSNGDYWVCAGGDGLYVLHDGKWSLRLLKHPSYGPDPDCWPYFVVEAGPTIRWVFTSTTAWVDNNGTLAPLKAHYHGDRKDQMVNVHDACFVPNQGVLAATNHGLFLFSPDGTSFKQLDYCPTTDFSSVILSKDGTVWTSGSEGIVKVDLAKQKCEPYPFDFSSKGQNFFKTRSKFADATGRIYFGDRDGFFSFMPNSFALGQGVGHVGISGIIINGKPISFGYADSTDVSSKVMVYVDGSERGEWQLNGNGGELNLKYGETNVEFQFDVVDFNECPTRLYYRLKGLNDEWIPMPTDKSFVFSYIPSGSYTLEVASLGSDGSEPNILYSLKLTVSPPWWATWWFRLLMVALVVAFIYYKYRSIVNEKKVLQQKVDERTSELKTKNQLIEKRNSELNKVLSYKDRLIAVVAHDLKNPMFAIVGALEGMLRKNDTMPSDERKQVVGSVLGSARTLQTEMSKLLAWATSSQDDIEYRPANTDIAKIIENDFALLKASADGKGVSLLSEVNVRNYCYVDSRMISTVIRNIVSNSIKFTHAGKKVSLKAWQEGQSVKIQISDEGVGMSADKLKELQTEGRHTSTEGTSGEKGTGLGVGIVRDYVLQNNGSIYIDSTLNVGTTTTITLPLADAEVVESQLSSVNAVPDFEVDAELMAGNTILVVDDDPLICQNIKGMLDAYVNVLVANNGRQALDLMAQNAVDIVVSDVEMPVMNGIDVSVELSKNEALNHIPILFLSAKSSESDRLLGLLTGAIDYIPKPFSQNELLIKLNNILSLRQKQQQRLLAESIQHSVAPSVTPSVWPVDNSTDETAENTATDVEEASSEPTQVSADNKSEKINPLLQQMLDVIEKNYADSDYSVERLADDMCMTKITLYRRVKTLTGQTPVELLNDFRLHKAMALLKEGNIQVGDVAFQVGFSDPAYFTRRFRNFFGFPPSQVKPEK